ncbi:glutaredoxin family protein [bacterium]|nr:glutaredoxin family protein [bacterium]
MSKIELYVWDDCAYCRRAREVLARNGANKPDHEYIEHDITRNPEARLALQQRMESETPAMAPQVFVNDRLLGCCADLLDLELAGRLVARLNGEEDT